MSANSIVIVCDDIIVAKLLRVKLASLREVDSVKISSFLDAVFEIESNTPEVVIVYGKSDDETIFASIKKMKTAASELNAPILVVTDELSEDFILSGFDAGADDFASLKTSDGEFMMRVILCMQKNTLLKEVETKNKLLAELDVIQNESGFYTKNYSKKVFENEIKNIQKYSQQAVLMIISADINCKVQLPPAVLGSIVKKCTRNIDIIGYCGDDKFYVLLNKTGATGAISVYQRMKEEIDGQYSVSAGACEIDNLDFEEIEKNAFKSVQEAIELTGTIVVADTREDSEPINWLDKESTAQKNFKFFKQAFLKKLENVITPTFYQVQKIWEERLFNTTIEQSSDDTQSLFILRHGEEKSMLKITYPGFAKINIDIIHEFEGAFPKDRVSLDLTELTDTKLNEIILEFIKDYQSYCKDE